MPTAELTRRDGVELARTGTWDLSSGRWRAAPEDFAAAVAALKCPAVRRPYIRIGHTDDRFALADGEPAVGWIDNLRVAAGGASLVGDYADIPAWLDESPAYPDRSIEGAYNRKCALGHVHPFVLDGLALLGVTRPGVGTLKPIGGLADVKALFDPQPVAASADEVRIAASIPGAAIAAAAEVHAGAMIALIPTVEDAARLAVDGGEPADQMHCTLMYLGDAADLDATARQDIIDSVSEAVNGLPKVDADAFAVSLFNPAGPEPCVVLGLTGPELDLVHDLLDDALDEVELPEQHDPWIPHTTLRYGGDLSQIAGFADRTGPIVFDRVRIAFAGQHVDIPLLDEPAGDEDNDPELVAAAAGDEDNLRNYWVFGKGRAKWKRFTELYRRIKKFVGAERAKRIAASWFHLRYGYWPGDKRNRGVKASTDRGSGAMPNPQPSLADRVREAWNASGAPFGQHIHQVRAGVAIVLDESDRAFYRVPVTVDGDAVTFGEMARVMPDFVDYDETLVAASTTFATREESRPSTTVLDPPTVPLDPSPPAEPAQPAGPPDKPSQEEPMTPPDTGGVSVSPDVPQPAGPSTPGAEPEIHTEPEGVGPVSNLSADVRSRLGLSDTDDDAAVLSALDALKSKADSPPEPSPDQVAASAATVAENAELRKEVTVLASQMQTVTAELAAAKAKAAADVKASVLDDAQKQGKFAPAARPQWDTDYDEAPAAVTRILASIAPGTAVPVTPAGYTGTGDEGGTDVIDSEYERLFNVPQKAGA